MSTGRTFLSSLPSYLSNNHSLTLPRPSLTTIAGTIPLQISFLVAFSQLVPAHTVTLFRGILSLRVPRFPLLYIGLVALLSLTPVLTTASLLLAVYGFLTSWTYLRFYKTIFPDLDSSNQPASLRGDSSDTFAFHEFFPAPAKPFVAAFGSAVFDALVALRVCAPFATAEGGYQPHHQQQQLQQQQHHRGVPGGARAEAERRRALALKALDQRLQAATAYSGQRGQASSTPPPPPPAQTPAVSQPAPTATGPTVQTQPAPVAQTAMTSQPGQQMLGETSYNPDHEHEKGGA